MRLVGQAAVVIWMLSAALTLASVSAQTRTSMTNTAIPPALVRAVLGSWQLGEHYRVTFTPSGSGRLHVHQEAIRRVRGRAESDADVEFDAEHGVLWFSGLGSIHRAFVQLRLQDDQLEYAIVAETGQGKQITSAWSKARRL